MWHEIKNSCRTFQLGDEPELIHIIKTGFRDVDMQYLLVYEDAYERDLGKTELVSKETIEIRFNINLNKYI